MSSNSLPYAADTDSPLDPAEFQVLRTQYENEGDQATVQTKFNYAWGLVKSMSRTNQQEGVQLISDIFRTVPERRRECLYYLALANFKLGNYGEARRYNDMLLKIQPFNLLALELGKMIEDQVSKDSMVGMAIVGGVAVAAGVLGSLLFKGMRSR